MPRPANQFGSNRPHLRVWRVLWEVEGNIVYTEVTLSCHICEPEAIRARAQVPEGAPCIFEPIL